MRLSVVSKPILSIAGVILLIAGVAIGAALPWDGFPDLFASRSAAPATGDDHAGHDHGAGDGMIDHVDLSPTARANLQLKTGRVKLSDYIRTLHIPGEIIEAPGYSTADVPARVAGIVSKIHVAPGQAVRPGMPLLDLDLTGEALAEAQSRLLDDLQQLATIDAELGRLGPLTESGAAAERRRLELEYDRRRIEGQRNTRIQELLIRGLTRAQVDTIITNRELVRSVTVVVPKFPEQTTPGEIEESVSATSPGETGSVAGAGSAVGTGSAESTGGRDDWEYTVETINVNPGESVAPEKGLTRLARHTKLHVQGHAFERDMPVIAALGPGQTVRVEFGIAEHGGIDGVFGTIAGRERHDHGNVLEGLELLYIDNHVDPRTQSYSFYIPLTNELLRDSTDDRGRIFRSWKYRPGQRVHVQIPVDRLPDRMVLPAAAVVTDGPEAFVFRLSSRHAVGETPEGKRLYDEMYKAVPVVIAHRDSRHVVIAPGGELREGDLIAMNRAYQLHLAMENATEGGGHHHGHDH